MAAVFFGVTTRLFKYSHTIGRNGEAGPGFRDPVDVALGQEGKIYVLNHSAEYEPIGVRVTVCTMEEQEFLGQIGRFGRGEGEFVWPSGIALDSQENVYISDNYLHRISMFNEKGEHLNHWGSEGSGDGELNMPSGLRFDKEDNLYVVDSANNRVQVFTKEGKLLAKWGSEGTGEGEFNLPWGITIDHNGDVWVADWRNDRVQKFTADGTFLASFGTSGKGVGQFNRPTDVAVDKDGDFYVTDWANDRVQVFTPDGLFITELTGNAGLSKWGQDIMDSNPDMVKQRALVQDLSREKHFWRPNAVEIDDQGHIVVIDCNRDRLQVYQKIS